MIDIVEYSKNHKIAIYGLGTETERFLSQYGKDLSIVCLLDGFRESGEIYGYPISPYTEIVKNGVSLIVVVARPGSCKAITKRIGSFCKENNIDLYDVRGNNLLEEKRVLYEFSGNEGFSRQVLLDKINEADIVSFDLFDTLITRKTFSYIDIIDLLELRLKEKGITIPNFTKLRIFAEKELSKHAAPKLEDIYDHVLNKLNDADISASELAEMEWNLDFASIVARDAVCDVFRDAVCKGKMLIISTDSYYSERHIKDILNKVGLTGYKELFISCEQGTSKTLEMFTKIVSKYPGKKILHVGDDEVADIEKPSEQGIDTYRIFSSVDLFDTLGGLDIENDNMELSDRVKVGMFVSDVFNSPFWFESNNQRLSVKNSNKIGYLFCAPIISDFVLWLKERATSEGYEQILFCSRDGYLPVMLYKMIMPDIKSLYFLSSRTAAIRAGMSDERDIEYIDSMKYFGSEEEELRTRFGIIVDRSYKIDRNQEILDRAKKHREKYLKYINGLYIDDDRLGIFDFVAKGTTQMYLQKLFSQHLKGFYFLQLEPEFMSDKGLDIEPFYSDEEKNESVIFDNYYILETMLTSPDPQLVEFNDDGEPVFASETRSGRDIEVIMQTQDGIKRYFEEYISLLPENARSINKQLDEKLLSMINKVCIEDEGFLALKVEDPFFGRMTDIKDILY